MQMKHTKENLITNLYLKNYFEDLKVVLKAFITLNLFHF